jgi:hypothetical protein
MESEVMIARIYLPPKNAMQSGKAAFRSWVLSFAPATPRRAEPLMGWTASDDTQRQVYLPFPSKEEAIAYAERHGIPYEVMEREGRKLEPKAYADNFRFDRRQPWTH